MLAILERIVEGKGEEGDIELLLELADTITATALCGLGKSAASPVVSTIKSFRAVTGSQVVDLRYLRDVLPDYDDGEGVARLANARSSSASGSIPRSARAAPSAPKPAR